MEYELCIKAHLSSCLQLDRVRRILGPAAWYSVFARTATSLSLIHVAALHLPLAIILVALSITAYIRLISISLGAVLFLLLPLLLLLLHLCRSIMRRGVSISIV